MSAERVGATNAGEAGATASSGRLALMLCRCGPHMAESLDFEALRRWATGLESVGHVEVHDLFCSPAGKAAYVESLRAGDFDGVVLAACTPKMHEETFRRLTEEAGLNLAQLQIANIREHCAWVTPDREEAMAKAKRLIEAALRRVSYAEALQRRSLPLRTELLVLGGGVAGMEAALTAARAGRQVYLVDRAISLGGAAMQTEEIAPSLECAPCLLAPLLAAVRDEPNVEVLCNTEVEQVVGFLGNFGVRLRQRAGYVGDECPGCEACYEVCSVERPSAFHRHLGPRKAIHALFAGSVPAAAVIEREECLHFIDGSCDACVGACPFEVIDFEQRDVERTVEVGAIVLATGAATPRLEDFPQLGYGRYPEVYSSAEAERLLASNGPTNGQLLRRDGQPRARWRCCIAPAPVAPMGWPTARASAVARRTSWRCWRASSCPSWSSIRSTSSSSRWVRRHGACRRPPSPRGRIGSTRPPRRVSRLHCTTHSCACEATASSR